MKLSYRVRTKIKALEYKGSKCEMCGYDKCKQSLTFHHIDEKTKSFNISRASKNWETIQKELDKCMLVCSNCHHLVHNKQKTINKSTCSRRAGNIKEWRKKLKQRILQLFNGKCSLCFYDVCADSLCLHHLNPEEKEYTFGEIRASPKSWDIIKKEIAKCVLLCHNCHCEVHYNNRQIDSTYLASNEDIENIFTDNVVETKPVEMIECKVCSKQTTNEMFCSNECTHRSKRKVDWDLIDLIKARETKTKAQIARELGVSETVIRKRLLKINLRVPSSNLGG